MPHDDRPLPLQLSDDREYVAHVGVDGVVLARAPAGFAEAALVEARHFAVARKRFSDADPIVGVEVVGAVHEQDGRSPARAEGAVEDRYVAGIHPSVALHGWRLLVLSWLASLSHRRALRHAAARAVTLCALAGCLQQVPQIAHVGHALEREHALDQRGAFLSA